METKYYLIKSDINLFSISSEWQLKEGNVIQVVNSNMFIAKSIKNAILNNFQQLNMFEMDLIKILIKYNANEIKEV